MACRPAGGVGVVDHLEDKIFQLSCLDEVFNFPTSVSAVGSQVIVVLVKRTLVDHIVRLVGSDRRGVAKLSLLRARIFSGCVFSGV